MIEAVEIQRCIWHVYPFYVLGSNINLSFGQIIACTRSVVLDPYSFYLELCKRPTVESGPPISPL